MAYPTFVNMQDEVIARDYGATAERTNIKLFINDTLREVMAKFRWTWSETTGVVAAVASTESITLPTDLLWLGRIRPNDLVSPQLIWVNPGNLSETSPLNTFNPTAAAYRGVPKYVTQYGSSLYLDPTSDGSYSWKIYYWKGATTLSADGDEPPLPPEDREVLVYGALVRCAQRDRAFDAAQYWQNQYELKLSDMRVKDTVATQATRKVPMSRAYHGKYDRNGV